MKLGLRESVSCTNRRHALTLLAMRAVICDLRLAPRIAALLTMLAIASSGCATAPEMADDPIGAVPHDFSVDVAILLGHGVDVSHEAHRRPLRIMLYPDGSLHSEAHPQRGRVNWVPGLTRRLDRDQMAQLYTLARQLNLSDPDRSDEFINPKLIQPRREEMIYQLTMTAGDERWMFLRRHHAEDEPDPAVTRFIRHLAELAWETDLPLERPVVMPKRYDFGPDPYAQYR